MNASTVVCPGCGVTTPDSDAPTHAYIVSSPGCWSRYCEALALEYSNPAYGVVHQLTVDTYSVQHPGPDPRAIRSVALHLIGLYGAFEHAKDARFGGSATQMLRRASERDDVFTLLTPPTHSYDVTIDDVLACAEDPAKYADAVKRWASVTWSAWSSYHDLVAQWAGQDTSI